MMSANWWRGVLWLLVLAAAIYVISRIQSTLTIFILGFLIAYILNPLVERLQGRKLGPIQHLSRGLAILVVYILIILALVAAGLIVVPLAVDQTEDMIDSAPKVLARAQNYANDIQVQYVRRVPESVRAQVESAISNSLATLSTYLGRGLQYLANFMLSAISGVFFFLTGLLVALYLLLNWNGLLSSWVLMFPYTYRDDVRALAVQMNNIFGGYLRATIITSVVCGVVTFVCLLITTMAFGIHGYPTLLVSLVSMITYPIPVVGAAGSMVLAGLLGFGITGNILFAIVATCVVCGVNQAVDRTLAPKLMSDAMGVSPLFVLFAAFAGGEFLGVTGMLLGIPLAAMFKAFFSWFHGRFLVAPEELAQKDTRELWETAAKMPRAARPVAMALPAEPSVVTAQEAPPQAAAQAPSEPSAWDLQAPPIQVEKEVPPSASGEAPS